MESNLNIENNERIPLESMIARARSHIQESDEERFLNPDDLLRFLRARNLNVDQALEMWLGWKE